MKCPELPEGKITKGDVASLVTCVPDGSIDLVMTSPPYAGMRSDHYSSMDSSEYPGWFLPISKELLRAIKPTGSFVLNIKENMVDGARDPYVLKTVLGMLDQGWKLAETYIWNKPNAYPLKSSRRLKDGFEYAYHFVKDPKAFKIFPDNVKVPARESGCYRMSYVKPGETTGTGSAKYTRMMAGKDCIKSTVYPSNVLTIGVGSNRGAYHPARFPPALPRFFINLLTEPGDVVVDPFAGSGTTNVEAKKSCRRTFGFDLKPEYVKDANDRLKMVTCEKNS